jgi:hypothetical protein
MGKECRKHVEFPQKNLDTDFTLVTYMYDTDLRFKSVVT